MVDFELYRSELSRHIKQLAVTLESLPDLLERDAHLPPEAVERAVVIIDALRERMYQAMVESA